MAKFSDPGGDYNPYAPPSPTSEIEQALTGRDDDDEPVVLLAERGTRWWARVVDNLLLGASSIPAVIMLGENRGGDSTAALAMFVLPFALLCYQWYLIATSGQSLAKRWMKIKVVRLDNGPVGFVHGVLLREWILFGFQMIPILGRIVGLADAVMIFGNDRRCLHDQIAGTKVVLVLRT